MACDSCGSDRILSLTAKCSDRCSATFNGVDKNDYAPDVTNICGGDYVEPDICLECGKVQGTFPVTDPEGFENVKFVCDECGEEPISWKRRPERGDRCHKANDVEVWCGGYYYEAEE